MNNWHNIPGIDNTDVLNVPGGVVLCYAGLDSGGHVAVSAVLVPGCYSDGRTLVPGHLSPAYYRRPAADLPTTPNGEHAL